MVLNQLPTLEILHYHALLLNLLFANLIFIFIFMYFYSLLWWCFFFLLQSGCCKPPTQCGYTFVNPTYWISPINNAADMDCLQWSNDQTQLCFNCDSCKAGLLANLKKEWRRTDIILLITLVALISVYLIGCCAFRNAKTEDLFRKYKQGYT